jgi:hypothetical protein
MGVLFVFIKPNLHKFSLGIVSFFQSPTSSHNLKLSDSSSSILLAFLLMLQEKDQKLRKATSAFLVKDQKNLMLLILRKDE